MPTTKCCPVKSVCLDPADPILNLSSEDPDLDLFIGYNSGYYGTPPVGTVWDSLGCVAFCESSVSQADADRCAAEQQIFCTVDNNGPGQGGGPGGGGWRDPNGNPVPIWANSIQTCNITCPDGLPFNYAEAAAKWFGLNQAQANAIAQSFACKVGEASKLCLNDISGSCLNQPYSATISSDGGTSPLNFSIIAGTLPPGLSVQQQSDRSMTLFGTPTVAGNYSFTVRCVDAHGLFMVKTFDLAVLGITNAPPDATQNSAYSFQYSAAGGTPPYTFALGSGALPDGLTLTSTGLLSGTPTVAQFFAFGITLSDSSP